MKVAEKNKVNKAGSLAPWEDRKMEAKYIAVAVWENWTKEADLGDRVLTLACLGGRDGHGQYREPQKYFTVPSAEYKASGFVIDLDRDRSITDDQAADLLHRLYKDMKPWVNKMVNT